MHDRGTSNYETISVPIELFQRVERYLVIHPDDGYSSTTEFFKEATRDSLRRLTTGTIPA